VAYLLETLTNNLNDAPATLGAPDETLILHADRFALRTGPADDPVYPMVVQDINGTPTVVLDTAIIRDGAIQKGQIGAIGFGQIVDENDLPVTTVAGKLKGDLIEADNLKVAEAATFTGIAQSTNFATGLDGWLLNPNGQFEANNATFRGHVEMDTGHISETVQIGGTVASTVRDNASTARSRVDQWVKPGFTWIDGTQIYTGDAYVDTLQIKGQAVTFPRGTTNAGTLTLPNGAYHSVLSLYAAHTGAPIIVTVSINFPSRAQIYNSRETLSAVVKRGDTTLYGPVSLRSSVLDGTEAAFTPGVFGFSFYLPTSASGTYTVQLSGSSSTSVEISTRSITILEAKR
jgi:cytoskeletal protein CcmA (bactofilin family)